MTKAFFYDSVCGMIYRCMFAGLDENGHAKWVSITPGEESKTLEDVVKEDIIEDTRFLLIGLEGETVQPETIAKVMGKVMEFPLEDLGMELKYAICKLKRLGVNWYKEPLKLEFRVFENKNHSTRRGKYSLWIENKKDLTFNLSDIDGFNDLNELFGCIRMFFLALEMIAEIPVITKDLRICDKLRKEVRKSDLGMFSSILKEYDCFENENEK